MKKHSRYLTITLATTAFLTSSPSHALGIGNIKLQSALNQNLKAEIALTLSADENPADLKIGLAPITKFDEAGIPWTVFLSKIQFQTVTENGQTVIKLSSKEALKEPFLDFVVEIKSPKSNIFREFTTLVDPPENYKTADAPKQTATISTLPQRFVTPSENMAKKLPTAAILKPKIKPKVAPIPKTSEAKNSPVTDQKVIALEKQIAEMKQMLLEQNVQIMALKNGTLSPSVLSEKVPVSSESTATPIVIPVTPPVNVIASPAPVASVNNVVVPQIPAIPTPVTNTNTITAILPPVISTATPTVSEMSTVVTPPQSSLPVVIPPIIQPPKAPPLAESPDFMTELFHFVETTSADSYYYIAGATGSLLLSILGWLRLQNRYKKNEDETVIETKSEVTPEDEKISTEENQSIVEGDSYFLDDTVYKIFDDNFDSDGEHIEFNDGNFPQFEPLVDNKTPNETNVLYKADVYCAYGSHDKAIALLQDEFKKHPDADDYALQLLKLYVSQEYKSEFKELVHELATLGKKENFEFWAEVTDMAADFHPEALFFVTPPAIPRYENDTKETFNHQLNFDVMRFDQEITDEQINDEFLKKNVQAQEIDTDEFVFSDLAVTEKKDEFHTDFDFKVFDVEEKTLSEKIIAPEFDAAFDMDFTTFEIEKEAVIEEPKFLSDAEFDLDFTTFEIEKEAVIEEPKFLSDAEFDLDFTTFEIEKEAIAEKNVEPKFDTAFDLDFTTFEVKNDDATNVAESVAEDGFDFDFSLFSTEKEPSSDKIK